MSVLGFFLVLLLISSLLMVAVTCLMASVFRGQSIRLNGPGLVLVLWEWISTLRAYALQPLFIGRPTVRRRPARPALAA